MSKDRCPSLVRELDTNGVQRIESVECPESCVIPGGLDLEFIRSRFNPLRYLLGETVVTSVCSLSLFDEAKQNKLESEEPTVDYNSGTLTPHMVANIARPII